MQNKNSSQPMATPGESKQQHLFVIPLPGGRAAKVPLSVLEGFLATGHAPGHDPAQRPEDVTAHSMSVDSTTGTNIWHTEWELGSCEYTDENGYHQQAVAWHRHPLGTEYTEIFTQ
jgi:hypothetical protein